MPTPDPRPNILLICVDQWRADALGAFGHPVVETPHLDLLAQSCACFSQAYSATPTCIPARAEMLTGMSQSQHGFLSYDASVEWHYRQSMPKLLADAGYHTHCVGKMHVKPPRQLLGFHSVELHDGYLHPNRAEGCDQTMYDDYLPWLRDRLGRAEADHIDSCAGCNGYVVHPWPYNEMLHPSSWVVTRSIDFLRRRDTTKPFFLKMSFHRPHPPFDPPKHYLERYLTKTLPPVRMGNWVNHNIREGGGDSPIPRDRAQIDMARRGYYAMITHIDHQLNRMIMALNEYGVANNTAIVFVSDHGEQLYDHNHVAKAMPYDGSARIPFMLRMPPQGWSEHSQGQQTLKHVVGLRDLLPTFCELAGVEPPANIDGRSLLPLLIGDDSNWRQELHGEHCWGDLSNHWMTDGCEKYIWFSQSGDQQLFNLANDPCELRNLASEQPERVAHWRQRLCAALDGREHSPVVNGDLEAGHPPVTALSYAGVGLAQ